MDRRRSPPRRSQRLELVADTYLSVSTPVQVAAPRLIAAGRGIRAAITARVRENLDALRRAVAAHPAITLRDPEGGWSAVLEVPATMSDEALVLRILEAHVLVHPGYFFDFARGAFLVVSLLPRPEIFRDAIARALPHRGRRPAVVSRHAGVILPLFSAASARSWGSASSRISTR